MLAAFVGEAVRAAAAEQPTAKPAAMFERFRFRGATVLTAGLLAQNAASNPCTVISNFISGMLAVVFDRLEIQTDVGGVLGFFVDLYNGAVELAKQVITASRR